MTDLKQFFDDKFIFTAGNTCNDATTITRYSNNCKWAWVTR